MSPAPLGQLFHDGRLTANLIAVLAVMGVLVLVSAVLRILIAHGSNRLVRWGGAARLEALGKEATRHGRTMLFWLTATGLGLAGAGGVAYHLLDGDVRADLGAWLRRRTAEDFVRVGLAVGALAALAVGAWAAMRLRRLLPLARQHVIARLATPDNEETLQRWFVLFDGYTVAAVRLGFLLGAGHAVGLGAFANATFGFGLWVLTILVVARLLTLANRALTHKARDHGDRRITRRTPRRYWERIKRLFPFGERCFDAAVWVSAASLCVRALHFIAVVADFGPRVVQCIGIFFCCRVVIELLQVLLHEAFGLHEDGRHADQKGRTLVPLLHSLCQYVLYFGSVVLMLGVLGVDTTPIMAGAGILGLAVGLGGQSLVTDVVSGFFILFENQFLVGDYVKVGDAVGTVEEVGMRVTKIRDGQGKLHIIPNGQIKGVVSFSKGYINAVVDYPVPGGRDVEAVFRAMREAGDRLRQARPEVLAATEILGIVDLKASEMTVRAVTQVQPGTHEAMQNEYRRLLRQVFDERDGAAGPRLAA